MDTGYFGWVTRRRFCTRISLEAQGRSVDAKGLALVTQSAQQGLREIFVAQQLVPLLIF